MNITRLLLAIVSAGSILVSAGSISPTTARQYRQGYIPQSGPADLYCLQGRIWGYPGNCQFATYEQCMTLTERLDANEEQLARVLTSASEPKATPEAPPQVSPEEPTVMPDVPLPRPRQPASVAQTQRPPPTPERSQAKKPQPLLAWPCARVP